MIKITIRNMVILLVTLSSLGCSQWFDVSPKSDVKLEDLFQSQNGFRDVLIGCYSLMASNSMYGKELTWGTVDILAQYTSQIGNIDHEYYKMSRYKYEEPEVERVINKVWGNGYKAISNLNAILSYIDQQKHVFSSEAEYNLMKGEVLALRAFLHFDLCRLFGPVPIKGNSEQLAIPYMKDYTNIAKEPLSMSSIYIAAIEDIDLALELMKEHDLFGPNFETLRSGSDKDAQGVYRRSKRLNYYAALLLKARVCCYFGEKEKALNTVKEFIPTAESLLPAPLSLTSNPENEHRFFLSEQLFVLDQENLDEKIDPYFGNTAKELGGTSKQRLIFMKWMKNNLYSKVAANDNDFRLQKWFQEYDGGSDMLGKFEKSDVLPLLHISEFYYIAAECATEVEGLNYLNKIRAHRGLAPISSSQLTNELSNELKKEFMGEGQTFYYFKRTASKSLGVFGNIQVGDLERYYQLPYPKMELDYGHVTL